MHFAGSLDVGGGTPALRRRAKRGTVVDWDIGRQLYRLEDGMRARALVCGGEGRAQEKRGRTKYERLRPSDVLSFECVDSGTLWEWFSRVSAFQCVLDWVKGQVSVFARVEMT